MNKFLITNNVNATYNKVFKIIESHYGVSARKYSDVEVQQDNGFMIGFYELAEEVYAEIKTLKYINEIV